jgi:hypothetical protein
MLCASHQPAALCEFFFITTSSLLRIYELIVSEDEGFVKNFLPRVSAFLPANSLNLSTDLKNLQKTFPFVIKTLKKVLCQHDLAYLLHKTAF